MSVINHSISEIFTTYFPRIDASFEKREGQVEFSEHISTTMEQGGVLVAEAGTGTGKSFSYIVPAIQHALQGKRIVIVTATISLQHQLVNKDIPYIQSLLGTQVPVSILKGRNNYLCMSRLNSVKAQEQDYIISREKELTLLFEWAEHTITGDKEDIGNTVQIPNSIWREVCAHEYVCGGIHCHSRNCEGCFFIEARKQARQASIVITNYSLLTQHLKLLDMSDNQSSGEGLLPHDAIFILDEAHRIKDIVREGLKNSIHLIEVEQMYMLLFGKQGIITLAQHERGGAFQAPLQEHINQTKTQLQKISRALHTINKYVEEYHGDLFKYNLEIDFSVLYENDINILDKFHALFQDMQSLDDVLMMYSQFLSDDDSVREILLTFHGWMQEKLAILSLLSRKQNNHHVICSCMRFSDTHFLYSVTPLQVQDFLMEHLFTHDSHIICTSATLTAYNSFDFWSQQVGISSEYMNTLLIPSPFLFKEQVLLTIPEDAPSLRYDEAQYIKYLQKILPSCLDYSEGRALILCTSYKMIEVLASTLYALEKKSKWNIIVQKKQATISSLVEQFRADVHSVLLCTSSFWEGFDAQGDTLQLLIITQLPFMPPDNLFFKKESMQITMNGGNVFTELSLPIAEIRLRQGFGRLIRSTSDHGVVMITDNRILGYNQVLLNALPNCSTRICTSHAMMQEVQDYFKQ